jgi:hypothetical protein
MSKKSEIVKLYQDHFLPTLKHLEHQIFHKKMHMLSETEQSDFLQNAIDSERIQNLSKV